MKKTCNTCNKTLDISEFYKDSKGKDGYRNDCKSCKRKKHPHKKGYYKIRKEKSVEYPLDTTYKTCKSCGEEKTLNEFRIDYNGKYNRKSHCRKCMTKNENIKRKSTV